MFTTFNITLQICTAIPFHFCSCARDSVSRCLLCSYSNSSSKKVRMPAGSLSGVLARKSHRFRMSGSMLTARALGPLFTTANGNSNCGLDSYSGNLGFLSQCQNCFAVLSAGNTYKCHKMAGTFRCASCSTEGLLLSITGTCWVLD